MPNRLKFIQWEVKPDVGEPYRAVIDPGPIPPTYRHSWASDLHNITEFRLSAAADGVNL